MSDYVQEQDIDINTADEGIMSHIQELPEHQNGD